MPNTVKCLQFNFDRQKFLKPGGLLMTSLLAHDMLSPGVTIEGLGILFKKIEAHFLKKRLNYRPIKITLKSF